MTGCLAALAMTAVPLIGSAQMASATTGSTSSQSEWGHHRGHSRHGGGYVALGDSFSSGEGTGTYDPASNSSSNQCHRSGLAYGPLLKRDSEHRQGSFSFVACSGAVTRDLYNASVLNPSEGPQLNVLQRRTRKVSLTIGGNDVAFGQVAKSCVESTITPKRFGCRTDVALNALINARLSDLAGTSTGPTATVPVKKILTDIHAKSPRAKIYLAGYPELFGSSRVHATSDQTAPSGRSCVVIPSFGGRVDYADTQWINAKTRQLNRVLSQAVRQAKGMGIDATFVSASSFNTHGLCDSKASWVNPVLVAGGKTILAESLHPTAVGQRKGYAAAFRKAGF